MSYTLVKNPMTDDKHRQAYNRLATDTFRLSFENWYNSGYFDGSHIPYTLFDGEKAVANISVNVMDVCFDGRQRKYIQLGTVMTDKAYRGQGLQKIIFNQIMEDFKDRFDAMFLFANKTVLDFYPKYGFEKAVEYSLEKIVEGKGGRVKKLDMTDARDVQMFRKFYDNGNPFSALAVVNGFALEMFYLTGPYSDCVYYLPQQNAVVVAEIDEGKLTVLDVFCTADKNLDDIILTLCDGRTKVSLGFVPLNTAGYEKHLLNDEDTTLFVHKDGENIFADRQLLFPLIAHT